RRVLLVVLEARLDDRRALEQIRVLLGAEVLELQEVLDQTHAGLHGLDARKSLISGHRMSTICCASAWLRISGGTRRITLSAVTLIISPAAAARPRSSPQGRASAMPSIRPGPRTSTKPPTPSSSRSKPARSAAATPAAVSRTARK